MKAKRSDARFWFEVLVGGRPRGPGTLARWMQRQERDYLVENNISPFNFSRESFEVYMHAKASVALAARAVDACLDKV